jgi:hypothetical protein
LGATITGWAGNCFTVPLPSVPEREGLVHHGNAGPVAPNEGSVLLQAPIDAGWTPDDWDAFSVGAKPMNLWGIVDYDTGFPEVKGETGFGFE